MGKIQVIQVTKSYEWQASILGKKDIAERIIK